MRKELYFSVKFARLEIERSNRPKKILSFCHWNLTTKVSKSKENCSDRPTRNSIVFGYRTRRKKFVSRNKINGENLCNSRCSIQDFFTDRFFLVTIEYEVK